MEAFVLTLLIVSALCDGLPTQETIEWSHGNFSDPGLLVTGESTSDGTCVCKVQVPATVICTDYQAESNLQKLQEIQQQVSQLTLEVKKLNETTNLHSQLFAAFESNLTEVTSTFELIEGGQVLVTRLEIEGVLSRIRSMESTLYSLREWHGIETDVAHMSRIQIMMNEASNITKIMDAMASQNIIDDSAAMQREILSLTDQLRSCNDHVTSAGGDGGSQLAGVATEMPATGQQDKVDESDTLPRLWPAKKTQNSCGKLLDVSEPYTVRGNLLTNGTWMRDPLMNTDIVYYHGFKSGYRTSDSPTYFKSGSSVKSFQRGETHQIAGESLEFVVESVVRNGVVYTYSRSEITERYHDYYHRTRTVYEQNLSKIELSHSLFPPRATDDEFQRGVTATELEQARYLPPTVVPNADLTVDESGLWLLYGDSRGMLTVSKVDPDTLQFNHTLHAAYPKDRLGNCFVACAKVYCVDSYTDFDSRVSYFVDTESGFEGFTNIPFIIKYGSLSSLEYNPYDQLLYGWDNGHAVIYSLTFE
ncbi:noelin-like [Acanthaster planci]|uniref:Noelin-like n=1 Tax=Acanthaster planci TaxID=133434 RepID=A0A8B7YKG1_ACAPL|nr:noelin-like [Acanthaster planci]XP_022093753.1 noelin-like [Acanthaster planci]